MEYLILSVLVTALIVFLSYQRNPRFKASLDKTASITKKNVRAWWYMQWHKRRLWQVDRVKKQHAEQLARMQKLIAKDYKLSTNKDWKGAGSHQGDKQNNQGNNKGQKQDKPDELARKRAWAEFLLYTTSWTELSCYGDVLNLLSAEAESRAKAKGYSIQVLFDKTAIVFDRESMPLVRINTITGEIERMNQPKKAPVIRQQKAQVFEADNRAPAARRPMTADEINAEIAASTQFDDNYYN